MKHFSISYRKESLGPQERVTIGHSSLSTCCRVLVFAENRVAIVTACNQGGGMNYNSENERKEEDNLNTHTIKKKQSENQNELSVAIVSCLTHYMLVHKVLKSLTVSTTAFTS